MQLGPLWGDPMKLPIHVKAILVILVARAQRDRKVAKHFLVQISASAASGKLDFTGVEEQMLKYRNAKVLQWLAPRHAYLYTLMMSLLEIARTKYKVSVSGLPARSEASAPLVICVALLPELSAVQSALPVRVKYNRLPTNVIFEASLIEAAAVVRTCADVAGALSTSIRLISVALVK